MSWLCLYTTGHRNRSVKAVLFGYETSGRRECGFSEMSLIKEKGRTFVSLTAPNK